MINLAQIDEQAAMRQTLLNIEDTTEDLFYLVDKKSASWQSYSQMHDMSWLFHENGLEGLVVTYPEIRSVVDHKLVSDISLQPTYEHISNQQWCLAQIQEKITDRSAEITLPFIHELHNRLVNNPKKEGVYRHDIPIHRTYFHEIAQPADIPDRLVDVLEFLKAGKSEEQHPITFAAEVHHRFMRCFPFSKHSGTIGRLLLYFQLGRMRYLPAVIHTEDRQRYYESLKGKPTATRDFLAKTMLDVLVNAEQQLGLAEQLRHVN